MHTTRLWNNLHQVRSKSNDIKKENHDFMLVIKAKNNSLFYEESYIWKYFL